MSLKHLMKFTTVEDLLVKYKVFEELWKGDVLLTPKTRMVRGCIDLE